MLLIYESQVFKEREPVLAGSHTFCFSFDACEQVPYMRQQLVAQLLGWA